MHISPLPQDKKFRILIIEDDANFRYLLQIHLAQAGYEVRVAEDGVDGGRALLADAPDLIVSDISMPYLNGFELLSLLKRDPATATIPVILISGSVDHDILAKVTDMGAADFLGKPVMRDDLLAAVEACLRRSGRWDR